MQARRAGLYTSGVLLALFCVRLLGAHWQTRFPPVFPDALNPGRVDTYYAVSEVAPWRPRFYWSPRPIGYPAVVWLFARSSLWIVVAQTAAYFAAFWALGATAWRTLRFRPLAYVAAVLIGLVAVQARFALWNTHILSESLAITLGIAATAAWWRFVAAPGVGGLGWAWGFTWGWLLVRDAHAVPLAVVVVPIALTVGYLARRLDPAVRRRLLVGAVVSVALCGYVYVAQNVSKRNQYPFHNNVGMRILTDADLTEWFADRGMPLDDALRDRTGKDAFADDRFFVDHPSLEEYRDWADSSGRFLFLTSLVRLAPEWGSRLHDEIDRHVGDDFRAYDTYGVNDRLPRRIWLQIAGPHTRGGLWVWSALAGIALAAGAAVALRRRNDDRGRILFAAAGLALAFVDVYASYVGDALEVGRHLVGALSRTTVMLVVAVAVGADALLRDPEALPDPAPASEREPRPAAREPVDA